MPVCIKNTPVYTAARKFQHFHINHTHSAHLKTTQEEILPGPSQLQKLNQFKPILASGKNKKPQISTFLHKFDPHQLQISERFLYFQNPWTLRMTMVPADPGFIQY